MTKKSRQFVGRLKQRRCGACNASLKKIETAAQWECGRCGITYTDVLIRQITQKGKEIADGII